MALFSDLPVAPVGRMLFVAGLFAWILGAILTHVTTLAMFASVGTVLLAIGPTLFWVGLAIILIDWLLSHF